MGLENKVGDLLIDPLVTKKSINHNEEIPTNRTAKMRFEGVYFVPQIRMMAANVPRNGMQMYSKPTEIGFP
jgi:hypothetical protein